VFDSDEPLSGSDAMILLASVKERLEAFDERLLRVIETLERLSPPAGKTT
jgi:hypothetical protein